MTHAAIADPLPGARILVVDDDRDTAESMARLLRHFGHEVEIAFDGYEAIELARRQRPRYALLDLGLPGMDGYQVASRLREDLDVSIVIIAITGYGQEEDRRRALAGGFDHYLLKPIDLDALIAMLAASNISPPPEAMGREGRPMLMVSRQVELTNTLGLHLRAAAKFVSLAQQFQAEVMVACDGRKVSGRSILDMATLAAACGSRLELEAEGPDAEAALEALTDLIRRRFDEES